MDELILILGGLILDAGVAATFVAGIGSLAMVATRQPSRRRALARAAVLCTLVVIPLACLRPFASFDLLGPIRLAFLPIVDRDLISTPAMPRWAIASVQLLPVVLLIAYVTGVGIGLARLAIGAFGAGWIRRNSDHPSAESEALYQAIPARLRPKLRVSPRVSRPVLLGMFRQTILIPPEFDRLESSGALRLALLHELAHAEASDPWFGLAYELACSLWFWLPPLRWIGRQMRLDQEILADRGASDHLCAPSRYATTLVEFASASRTWADRRAPASDGSALLRRVLMLIRCPFPVELRPPQWWRGLLGFVTALVLLLATSLSLGARPHPSPTYRHGPGPKCLSLAQVVLEASGSTSPDVALPIRLPKDFDLTFEVISDAAELSQIRVLSHPLSPVRSPLLLLLPGVSQSHQVTIYRRDGTISLTLDSGPMTVLPGPSTEEWLVAQGVSGRSTVLRSIRLTW